jgi:hypothetical protein
MEAPERPASAELPDPDLGVCPHLDARHPGQLFPSSRARTRALHCGDLVLSRLDAEDDVLARRDFAVQPVALLSAQVLWVVGGSPFVVGHVIRSCDVKSAEGARAVVDESQRDLALQLVGLSTPARHEEQSARTDQPGQREANQPNREAAKPVDARAGGPGDRWARSRN